VDDLRLLDDLLDELTGDAPLADPRELAPARARLDAELTGGRTPAYRRFRPGRRLLWSAAAAGLAGAAAVAVLVAAQPHHTGTPDSPRLVNADAARVLNTAAAAALTLPDTPPRPNQFIYQKSVVDGATWESWRSVDGTRDSVTLQPDGDRTVLPGCRNGVTYVHGNYHGTRPTSCTPSPEYRTDLPTTVNGMLDYLEHHMPGDGKDPQSLFKNFVELSSYDLPPQTRAALYRAGARLPGLYVNRDAVDGAGRHGIGIGWHYTGKCTDPCDRDDETIFDPHTYTVLGSRSNLSASALLETAVVDSVGQRP
jgi:hypothetical protein